MDIKIGVDVSSFLLVEESADSDQVGSLASEMCRRRDAVTAATGDEEDAESCSCDTSEIQADEGFDYDHDHDKDEEFSDVDDGDGLSSVDQRRRISWNRSCKMWWADAAAAAEEEEEEECSSWDIGINNISRNVKDEMEDRLFWETCMAVGYP